MHELLTTVQAAELLGVHRTSVTRWARRGLIAFWLRPDGSREFRRSDVERIAARRQSQFIEAGGTYAETA